MSLAGIRKGFQIQQLLPVKSCIFPLRCILLGSLLSRTPRPACAATHPHCCFSHWKSPCPSLLLASFQGFHRSFHLCNFPSLDDLTVLSPSVVPFSLFFFAYFSLPWDSSWGKLPGIKAQEIFRHCSLNCLILN